MSRPPVKFDGAAFSADGAAFSADASTFVTSTPSTYGTTGDWSVVVAATAKVAEYSTAPMKAASDASACGTSLECGRGCEGVRAVGRVGYESSRCGPA